MSATVKGPSNKAPRASRAEASIWMVRLHSEARTPELEAGFREWLTADPENARQFEHMTDVWELGGAVTADGLSRLRSWESSTSKVRWRPVAVGAMTCILGLFIAFWWWTASVYVTHHGEQRLVLLDDGSRVYLNSNSRLRVQFDTHQRRVRLERGEGFFEVAQDPKRAFFVQAGDRQVAVLGTTFVVRYEPVKTAITLVEGKVRVSPLSISASAKQRASIENQASSSAPAQNDAIEHAKRQTEKRAPGAAKAEVFTLVPGERLVLAQRAPPKIDTPRIEAVTAWRRGEVLLEATPLVEAIAEMNRYDKRQLMIDDTELATVRVSGIYRSGDSLGFARAVAELHGFEVTDSSDEIHLQRPTNGILPLQ